jgi:hypothetical protein
MSEGSPVDKVIIARLGLEGGGATIYGRVVEGQYVFWQDGSSIALDADDNEEWRTWESEAAADLSTVVPAKWPLMFPSDVHPAFVGWFRRHYEAARASLSEDERAYQSRSPHGYWREVFGEIRNA